MTTAISTTLTPAVSAHGVAATEFGIGARITLAVMSDNYVQIITDALAAADTTGLDVTTGDVSTFIAGSEEHLVRYTSQLVAGAARSGAHVSATIHFSRGCPGEVVCALPQGAGPLRSNIPRPEDTGISAAAEWALYPLEDTGRDGVDPDHMRDIYAAINYAKEDTGTFVASEHFVTRLEGDVARVIATAAAGWILVGRSVQHVTSHLTVSVNSPSR